MHGWWIADYASVLGVAFVVSWIVWVILSIVLHELSHGWAAMALGDDTPRATGHMTWNPLVHMGGFSLLALALIGIAWGAMPINPSRLRGRHGDAIVAFAGPAMNILLFLVACLLCVAWVVLGEHFAVQDPLYKNLTRFFYVGAFLNIALAIFNLIPAPPLDGSRIAASFSPGYTRLMMSPNGQWVGLAIFFIAFWFAGEIFFDTGHFLAHNTIDRLLALWDMDLATAFQAPAAGT
jgi:Zn-dependent protease